MCKEDVDVENKGNDWELYWILRITLIAEERFKMFHAFSQIIKPLVACSVHFPILSKKTKFPHSVKFFWPKIVSFFTYILYKH